MKEFLLNHSWEIAGWGISIIFTFFGSKKLAVASILKKTGDLLTEIGEFITDDNKDHVKKVLIDAEDINKAVETLRVEAPANANKL